MKRSNISSKLPERIVQQDNVSLVVGSPGQAQSLLLAATEVEAALSDLRLVARGENLQVRGEGAG